MKKKITEKSSYYYEDVKLHKTDYGLQTYLDLELIQTVIAKTNAQRCLITVYNDNQNQPRLNIKIFTNEKQKQ